MNFALDDSPETRAVRRLRRVMAVFTGLLVASTWPLWTPGTEFPDIPWFEWAVHWPPEQWDWIWLASLGVLLGMQFLPLQDACRWPTILRCTLIGGAVMLLPTDQHRLQPWVWQMLIGAILIAASPTDRMALNGLRVVTISIYFWSAVSKFDWAFIEGHGQVLLDGVADVLHVSTAFWSDTLRYSLAATFPLGELAVAMLLVFRRTRRWGMWAAILMHGALMLTLGPLGLRHEWGVFLWNAFFGVQAWLLFSRESSALRARQSDSQLGGLKASSARGFMGVVCLLPALSFAGWWDWWPSWAVYSSRPAIVRTYVHKDDAVLLPAILQSHIGHPDLMSTWCPTNLDTWSFEMCWCPMYPQERFRLAVIDGIQRDAGARVWAILLSSPHRWTTRRTPFQLGPTEIDQRLSEFWINTSPRKSPRSPASD